ncbi:MAG: cupin domain-containing protein, partial [Thermodesulfovibrionales bacterium]
LNLKRVLITRGAELIGHINHTKRHEIIYIIRGNLTIDIEDNAEFLKRGDCLYLRESVPKKISNRGGDEAELLIVW